MRDSKRKVSKYIALLEEDKLAEINPEDSVSMIGSYTSSTASNDRAKVAAKRAVLIAEAAALPEKMNIEQEELIIRQRKEEL